MNKLGDKKGAIEALRKSLELWDEQANTWGTLGHVLEDEDLESMWDEIEDLPGTAVPPPKQAAIWQGEPIIFGNHGEYCVVRSGFGLEVAKTADVAADQIVAHDATKNRRTRRT